MRNSLLPDSINVPAGHYAMRGARALLIALLLIGTGSAGAAAQIQRDPNGVNVNASGATTVFITYGNLGGKVPVEATWCGELMDAAPGLGQRCLPGTIFGHLPIRYDRSRFSGQDGFTDIMSIPPSVARRAYQAAEEGANSAFFYVRRFVDPTGQSPDEFVTVTCRMAGGGARVPFALLDVRLEFVTGDNVLSIEPGQMPPPVRARIAYNGTGRLIGRWEIVLPGEAPPTAEDLLTEATLPIELRGTQKRYTELDRFNVFLPPTGEFTLPGPDPEKILTTEKGLYMLLLRIEASDDKEGDSNLANAGAGSGIVHTGAVAGFPIPPLRYYVGSEGGQGIATTELRLLFPGAEPVPPGEPLTFGWTQTQAAVLYRLEVRNTADEDVLSALLQPGAGAYRAPSWLAERLGIEPFRWRVVALRAGGRAMATTPWRSSRVGHNAAITPSIQGARP